MGSASLIGRDHECAVVAHHVRLDAPDVEPALIVVGEAGIGKSELWSYGVALAAEQGWRVLAAAPAAAERDLSFAVLGDLFGRHLDGSDLELAGPQRRALEVALLRREAQGAPIDRRALYLAVGAVLSALSQGGPVLIAVDDTQWVDAASAQALAFAVRRTGGERLRVLATARLPHGDGAAGGWLVEPARSLRLQGLSAGATQRLIGERLGRRLSHAQLRRIHEAARGNPLHALELARSQDESALPGTVGAFEPGLDLSDLVLKRLSGLPGSTREFLLLASVTRQPSTDLLSAALSRRVEEDLARAVAAELVYVAGDRVWFRHPLYAAACARLAGADARRGAHRRVAEVTGDTESRARHLALGATAPDAEVAAALASAALRARMRGAPIVAAELATLAQRLTPDDDPSARTRRGIAAAVHLAEAGDTAAARALLGELLAGAQSSADRSRVLMGLSRIAYEAEGVEATRRLALQAIEAAQGDPVLTVEAQLAYIERSQRPVSERRTLAASALATLRSQPDPDPGLLSQALREVALADYHLGRGMSRDLMREAIELEQMVRPPPVVAWRASTILGECLKYVDGFDEADTLLRQACEQAEQEGDLASLAEILGHRAELALWLGDWATAESQAAGAVTSARQTEQDGRLAMALRYHALVAIHRGEEGNARTLAAQAAAAASRADDEWVAMLLAADLGFLELSLGNLTAARARFVEVDEVASRALLSEPRQWRYLGDYVEVLSASGRLPEAVDRLARLQEWATCGDGWAGAIAARASAQVQRRSGERSGGLEDLARAVALFEALPLPFETARTQLQLGAALRRAGQRSAARRTLDLAEEAFAALGAAGWVARCATERGRLSGRSSAADGLTAAEEAVATMVANGASNKEVAAALSISPRTVEVHLGHVYRKLGLRNRAELAARYR